MTLGLEVSHVAPLYNLGFVIIVLWLFVILVSVKVRDKRVYMTPWKLLFFAVIVFVIEEVLTVLRMQGVVDIPRHINGFFELIIISTFIYALLLQKERMKRL